MNQEFLYGIENLESLIKKIDSKKVFIVCDSSFSFLSIKDDVLNITTPYIIFNDFSSNPLHDDADKGRKIFVEEKCDLILAIGGGSSMDVAKCIKLDSGLNIPIIAIPTTAGTGSESTKHIVVYKDGKKESLGNDNNIPNYVIFEPKVLKTLPLYQKKCTVLDALCQGIESYWSINANDVTREFSKCAIELIVSNINEYLINNTEKSAQKIMEGANYSGRAINLTQTTAAHAMSYKITSMYHLPHGHAVAICLPKVWSKMLEKNSDENLTEIFDKIAKILGYSSSSEAIKGFELFLEKNNIGCPYVIENRENEIEILKESVNPVRLKNNPIQFTENELKEMYERILL